MRGDLSKVKGNGTCTVCNSVPYESLRKGRAQILSFMYCQYFETCTEMTCAMPNKRHWQRRELWLSKPVVRLITEGTSKQNRWFTPAKPWAAMSSKVAVLLSPHVKDASGIVSMEHDSIHCT